MRWWLVLIPATDPTLSSTGERLVVVEPAEKGCVGCAAAIMPHGVQDVL